MYSFFLKITLNIDYPIHLVTFSWILSLIQRFTIVLKLRDTINRSFCLYLMVRLTLFGYTRKRNPWTFGDNVLFCYVVFVTNATLFLLIKKYILQHTIIYTDYFTTIIIHSFGILLESLYIYGAKKPSTSELLRFFKRWLLPSLPPSYLS